MKKNCLRSIFALLFILVTVSLLVVSGFAAEYNDTAIDGATYNLKVGDTLNLYNPDYHYNMTFYDYYWGIDTGNSTNTGAVTVVDNNRYGNITAESAGTVVVYSELFCSYPVTNYGSRYNSASKRWESYTYTTYESRKYVRRITINVSSIDPPTVDPLPDSVTAADGKSASVTVNASTDSGTELSYQWYYANKGSSAFVKSSHKGKTYTSTLNQSRDGRRIYCVVTDGNGKSTKSETVTLNVADPIKITVQPKTASFVAGTETTTSVTATGEGKLSYQWYFKNAGASGYTKSLHKTAYYPVKMTPAVDGRKVYCVITDSYGQKVQTKTVTLKMKDQLAIYSQPIDDKSTPGDYVSATVKAAGNGTVKYQWYFKNAGASKYSKSSHKTDTYSVKMTSKVDGREVYCIITDSTGTKIKSETVTFTSVPVLKIKSQPQSITVKSGVTATATVQTVGGSNVKYQWYFKNAGDKKFTKSSITKSTYSTQMREAADGREIYCVITDSCGQKVTSATVTLNMAAPLVITKQPENAYQLVGETIKTSVSATGEGKLKYQWHIKDTTDTAFRKSSITSAEYSIKMHEGADGRQLYCVITDSYGQKAISNAVELVNTAPIVITKQMEDTPYDEAFIVEVPNPTKKQYDTDWYIKKATGYYRRVYSTAGIGNSDTESFTLSQVSSLRIGDPKEYIGGSVYCTISDKYGQTVTSQAATILP